MSVKILTRLSLIVAFLVLPVGLARADTLPLHGFPGLHLDPFLTPGPVSLGPPFGVFVPPMAFSPPQIGADVFIGGVWHVQDEIDVLIAGGAVVPTFVNGVGPFPIPYNMGPGSGLIIDSHFPDSPEIFPILDAFGNCNPLGQGLAEVGPVCRQLLNLTPFVVAWGTAVEERLFDVLPFGGFIVIPGGPGLPWRFDVDPPRRNQPVVIRFDEEAIYVDTGIPEPASLLLLGSGLAAIAGLRRRKKAS